MIERSDRATLLTGLTLGLVLTVLGIAPSSSSAQVFGRCDPGGVDLAGVATVRALVDGACACDGFRRHGEYVRCARAVARDAARADLIPRGCRSFVTRIYARSICGFNASGFIGPRVPCITLRSATGKVICRVRSALRCGNRLDGRVQQQACPGFETCLDATDSNGNGEIDNGDSGRCSGPVCGDGNVDPGEECDDNVLNSDTEPDACRTDCTLAGCGDGVIDAGEACDEAGENSDAPNAPCRASCTEPSCGDGIFDDSPTGRPAEACDDGILNSDTNPDACRTDCTEAGCGDGVIDAGEECDSGDASLCTFPASLGCSDSCQCASCPDGVVDLPVESCEVGVGSCDVGGSGTCTDGPFFGASCTGDDECKICPDADCSSFCSCPTAHILPLDPAAPGGQLRGASDRPISSTAGSLHVRTGRDIVPGASIELNPLVGGTLAFDVGGVASLCLFVVSDSPGTCSGGGPCETVGCTNSGTCEIGTCSNLGQCSVGSCSGAGACSETGVCDVSGSCEGACTDVGSCAAGTCSGGVNDGGACVDGTDCPDACVGGPNAGATCADDTACLSACAGGPNDGNACSGPGAGDAECQVCSTGAETGKQCMNSAECADACVGGNSAGSACTGDGDCSGTCLGGANPSAACLDDGACVNVCAGGADDGMTGCNVDAECDPACVAGMNDGQACGPPPGDDALCANRCVGGADDGLVCTDSTDCGGLCGTPLGATVCTDDADCLLCNGGTNDGLTCAGDSDCAGSCTGGPEDGNDCNLPADCPDSPTAGFGALTCVGGVGLGSGMFAACSGGVCGSGLHAGEACAGDLDCPVAFAVPDLQQHQDHCSDPDDACDSGASGVMDPVTGIIVPAGTSDLGCTAGVLDAAHGACNSPVSQSVGPAAPSFVAGDVMLFLNAVVSLRTGPCDAPAAGETPRLIPLTTGTATAGVMDALLDGNDPGPLAGQVRADDLVGVPFSCPEIILGGGSGARLVTAEPRLDSTIPGGKSVDVTLTLGLIGQ